MRGRIMKRELPSYPLERVKELVKTRRVRINRNAQESAADAFGWEEYDILDAILKLKGVHFSKSAPHNHIPRINVDYYKANGLKGEKIYTHFYISDEDDYLVINSFKQLEV